MFISFSVTLNLLQSWSGFDMVEKIGSCVKLKGCSLVINDVDSTTNNIQYNILSFAEVSAEVQPEEQITPAAPAEITGAPEAPRFTQTLQRQLDVFEGTSVTLMCIVVGQPRPTVTWYRVSWERWFCGSYGSR